MLPPLIRALPFFVFLLFISQLTVKAQSLSGTVADSTGAVIPNAIVSINSSSAPEPRLATSDRDGKFQFHRIDPGSYILTVSAPGFTSARQELNITASQQPFLQITLNPGSISSALVISAAKGSARLTDEIDQPVESVDSSQIEIRRPSSPMKALELSPNISFAGPNSVIQRPRIRGLSGNRVLVLIDGERLNNARTDSGTTGVSPSVLDVNSLSEIEVLSSSGSGLYGSDAIAGEINLVTRKPMLAEKGRLLAIKTGTQFETNGAIRNSGLSVDFSNTVFAVRAAGSLFRNDSYRAGGKSTSLSDVVAVGNFANQLANTLVGPPGSQAPLANIARTYGVWSLPANGVVENGQGHGGNAQLDMWLFPSQHHGFRYRQLNSQHYNIGLAFSTPPFDPFLSGSGFRRLDRYGLRYDGNGLNSRLVHFSASYYWQRYSQPQDQTALNIPNASSVGGDSSWTIQTIADPSVPGRTIDLNVLTGKASKFLYANASSNENKNTITSSGAEFQWSISLPLGSQVTSGIGFLQDRSRDEFARFTYDAAGNRINPVKGATTPNSDYSNLGWYNLFESSPLRWLKLTGSLRVDNWKTNAKPTSGFPLGSELSILNAALPQARLNPGELNLNGVAGADTLLQGTGRLDTNHTIATGSAGVLLRNRYGVSPYFRWSNSYREPEITTRYIVRDFGSPAFSVLLLSNTDLKPERGNNIESGLRITKQRWYATAGVFRNELSDFIRSVTSPVYFVTADATKGLFPLFPGGPHGIQLAQRINGTSARISGFESTAGADLRLSHFGTLSPFGVFGGLRGRDLSPQANALTLISKFYNAGGLIPLEGSSRDVPLGEIIPWQLHSGSRYLSQSGKFVLEYTARFQGRIRRADPMYLTAPNSTQYGSFASLAGFSTHSVKAGYRIEKEDYRISLNGGVNNIANRLYFEAFQTAPAAGRSFVVGLSLELRQQFPRH